MARYIDAEALIEALKADFDREGAKADDMAMRGLADVSVKYSHGQFCFLNAMERVKNTPTADVAPKSEVDNWYQLYRSIKEELKQEKMYHRETENLCDRYCIESQQAKKQVAREIFEEIEREIVAALASNYRALEEWDDGRCNDYILEIVNRIKGEIDALRGIEGFVEELKKKYTEGGEC